MTMISAAVPIGGALLSPLLAVAVDAWGWRWGAFLAGWVFLLIALPLSFKVRRSPESMGLLPDGDRPRMATHGKDSVNNTARENNRETDYTVGDAMSTMVYWIFVLTMTARVAAFSTISVHFVPLMVWKGLSQEQAALLLGAFAFLNLLSHFLLGWIADRVNKPRLMAACMLVPAAGVPPLIWGEAIWPLWLFTILFTVVDN